MDIFTDSRHRTEQAKKPTDIFTNEPQTERRNDRSDRRTDAGTNTNGGTSSRHQHGTTSEQMHRTQNAAPTKAGTESGESPPPTRYYNTIESGVKYGSKSSGATIRGDSL